ncbi:anhydro-N-acetylmuramic acid kinase [Candidatus Riflebacteria bacterium]
MKGKFTYFWGVNSGTSCDGIDLALVGFDRVRIGTIFTHTIPYPPDLQKKLKSSSFTPGFLASFNCYYAKIVAREIKYFIEKNPDAPAAKAIGSHGHTFWHQPVEKPFFDIPVTCTFQLGCGETLSYLAGLPVIWNFRAGEVAAGGQGAPLSAIFDRDFFQKKNMPVFVQNIGGIANFTLIVNGKAIIASDSGPGNMLIDLAMEEFTNGERLFDEDGKTAAAGSIIPELLRVLLADKYYKMPFPKTTGREIFNLAYLKKMLKPFARLKWEDILYTLTTLSARTISMAYRAVFKNQNQRAKVFLYGGGAKNILLGKLLRESCPEFDFFSTSSQGIDPDFKEAITFAYLAKLNLAGHAGNLPELTGAKHQFLLGQTSVVKRVG